MLNSVIIQGRLVADPEHKQTPSGVSCTTFRVACDRNFQPKDGSAKQTDFIPVVTWRNTADFVSRYFTKGKMIIVQGSLQSRSYTDKDGNKRTAYEVLADQVMFGESKSAESTRPAAPSNFPTPENFQEPAKGQSFSIGDFEEVDADDSDLPF